MADTLGDFWGLPASDKLMMDLTVANEDYTEKVSEQELSDLMDEYDELVSAADNFYLYGQRNLVGVDFNIKLRSIDLGEKAPSYKKENDEAFGNYLADNFFPNELEVFIDHINEIFSGILQKGDWGVSQLGRSGGHLVVEVPVLDVYDAIGYGNATIIEDIKERFFDSANDIINALTQIEEDIKNIKKQYAVDTFKEREFFETEIA